MVLLPNVLVSTARSGYSQNFGTSGATQPKLVKQPGHIQSTRGIMHMLPASALNSEYILRVDSGLDVHKGDVITAITLLDGKTTWPGLGLANTPIANEVWRVAEANEDSPGILPNRLVYLERLVGGGPIY